MDALLALLKTKMGTQQANLMISNLNLMRQESHAYQSAQLMLHAIEQLRQTYLKMPTPMATLSLKVCPTLAEASIPKLSVLLRRIELGLPARGMEPHEVSLISEHARALTPAYGDEPEFVLRLVYQNLLTYLRTLVFGEVYNRNDPRPVEALAQAWSPFAQTPDATPVAALPDEGVIIATGPQLQASSASSWEPSQILFHGAYGERLRLDKLDALRRFLRQTRPRVSPKTLASLIYVLIAPFPWGAAITVENRLVERYEPLSVDIEDGRPVDEVSEEELILRVDGATMVYRTGELSLDH